MQIMSPYGVWNSNVTELILNYDEQWKNTILFTVIYWRKNTKRRLLKISKQNSLVQSAWSINIKSVCNTIISAK